MQNEKTLQQMIQEYESQIPPEIMAIINGFDWKKQVRMIVNQNQLLLDVGADLEESVYLMILGVVDIEEVFKRMMEVHELPEDKVQKILTEVEKQVFEPMHAQLIKLESSEQEVEINNSQKNTVTINVQNSDAASTSDRDAILSEIEQDDKVVAPKSTQTNSYGITKPFSLSDAGIEVKTNNTNASTEKLNNVLDSSLVSNTVSEPVTIIGSSVKNENQSTQKYAVDPYREPIE